MTITIKCEYGDIGNHDRTAIIEVDDIDSAPMKVADVIKRYFCTEATLLKGHIDG